MNQLHDVDYMSNTAVLLYQTVKLFFWRQRNANECRTDTARAVENAVD
jgi:hypothetical protein